VTVAAAVLLACAALVVGVGALRSLLPRAVVKAAALLGALTLTGALVEACVELATGRAGWREVATCAGFLVVTGLGVTVGYHRLLAHRSFETSRPLTGVLLVLGAMGLPTRPLDFVAYHLQHHAHADADGDPHSPLEGFVHAHVGWFVASEARPPRERYCGRLERDRLVMAIDRTAMLWVAAGLAVPYLVAGWQGVFWGGLVRMAIGVNTTFAVNSVCHSFGTRPFATGDRSCNNLPLALLTLGEAWHNNHHAFPRSAYHGFGWRQPDPSGLVIRLLARVGAVWNVTAAPAPALRRERAVERS
jgi:stearoyl-CoA desaturase (delta-9 desaturase)